MYCVHCGQELSDDACFCTNCGNAVEKESVNQTTEPNKMYEEFIPMFGIGKRFVFTESSLIFGNDEYKYSQLSPISLNTAGTDISQGVAQTTTETGVLLTLAYNHKDNGRFSVALTYANEQINKAHGITPDYKYLLQSPLGSKIEVYDDYITLYYMELNTTKGSENVDTARKAFGMTGKGFAGKLASGLGKALDSVGGMANSLKTTAKGGITGTIIRFTNLSIRLDEDVLILNEYAIPINQQDGDLAKEIIAYIEATIEAVKNEPSIPPIEQELWEPIKGEVRMFPLNGGILEISADMDMFNSYRLRFEELALKCANRAKARYQTKIRDFVSFVEFFPEIYGENLGPIIQRALDILISEGIWSVTYETLFEQHLNDFHLAFDDYNVLLESVELTIQQNQKAVAGVMSFVPNLVGGGFGVKGALKGVAMAGVFNAVRDGIENSAVKNAANIRPAQQAELYGRINPDVLFTRMYTDYYNVLYSLIWTLNKNGHNIWWPRKDVDQQAKNIFCNLSNPNFPQERISSILIDLIKSNPYSPEYYDFALSRFGNSEELIKIKEYFGYEN